MPHRLGESLPEVFYRMHTLILPYELSNKVVTLIL